MRRFARAERGAAAVEFALVLIPLIVLLLGIIEFGYIFNQQLTVTNAAREGARVLAITRDADDAMPRPRTAASRSKRADRHNPASMPRHGGGDAEVVVTLALKPPSRASSRGSRTRRDHAHRKRSHAMRRLMRRLRAERGATATVVAFALIPLLGAGAIAVDVGALYAERAQLQNGVDAAALAIAATCAKE